MIRFILRCIGNPLFGIGFFLIVSGFFLWEKPFNSPESEKYLSWNEFSEIDFSTGFRSVSYAVNVISNDGSELVLMPHALNQKNIKKLKKFVEKDKYGIVGWFDRCVDYKYSLYKNRCKVLMVLSGKKGKIIKFSDSRSHLNREVSTHKMLFYIAPYVIGFVFLFISVLVSIRK